MLIGLVALLSGIAGEGGDRADSAALRECVNGALPSWSAVKAGGLRGTPQRALSADEPPATIWIDRSGDLRGARVGAVAFEKGELVVIAGIYPWGLRASSSLKHRVPSENGPADDDSTDFIDLDVVFDSLDCSIVRKAWNGLFDPVDMEAARKILSRGEVGPGDGKR